MHSEVICCNNRCFLCLKWLFILPLEEVTYRFDLLSIFYVFIYGTLENILINFVLYWVNLKKSYINIEYLLPLMKTEVLLVAH